MAVIWGSSAGSRIGSGWTKPSWSGFCAILKFYRDEAATVISLAPCAVAHLRIGGGDSAFHRHFTDSAGAGGGSAADFRREAASATHQIAAAALPAWDRDFIGLFRGPRCRL